MPVAQPKTVVIHAHGMVAAKSSNVVVQMLSKKLDFKKVRSVQFVPGGRIRVTFTCLEYRNLILARKTLQIDDLHHLNVTESDAPVTNVYVHYLPVEAGDIGIRLALAPFGKVHEVSHQQFAGFKGITTGTRIVRMSIDQHIPFQCNIQGYPCRVWYPGQPLKCTICQGSHKAADCPDRNKCRRCHQAGHFARDCKNAWNTTPQAHNFLNPQNVPPHPSGGPPPPPPSSTGHPVNSGASPVANPESASVDPVPLMSVHVHTPQPSDHVITEVIQESQEDAVSSIASLFSNAEDSVNEFSMDDSLLPSPPVPSPSPSPSISAFTSSSDSCSQSILKELPIVSSGPMVEQIILDVDNGPAASNIDGPAASSVVGPAASNGNGPAASSVVGPAASNVSGPAASSVVGPAASSVGPAASNVDGPAASSVGGPAASKSNYSSKVTGSKVTNKSKIPKPSGPKSVLSSDSDSEFRRPQAVAGEARSRSKSPAANVRSRSPLSPAGFHRLPSVSGSKPGRSR